MTNRTPSTQLIGKNTNNRDITIRCDINDLPADVDEWIVKAKEEGLPVDEDKTRAAGVVVGNHYGFAGLISYLAPLEKVHQAARLVNYAAEYDKINPAAGQTFLKVVKESGLALEDIDLESVTVGIYPSWRSVAEDFALVSPAYLADDGFAKTLDAYIDWEGFVRNVFAGEYAHFRFFEDTEGSVGLILILV